MKRVIIAAAILAALAGCKGKDQGYSAEDYAKVIEAEKQAAANPPPPSDDVMPSSTAEYLGLFEAKGVHLGMSRDDVAAALASKGFFIPPEGGSPMTEMVAELPTYSAADTAYIDRVSQHHAGSSPDNNPHPSTCSTPAAQRCGLEDLRPSPNQRHEHEITHRQIRH